ncbi:MAG: hypothetical protein ACRC6T_03305 [Sarcina sp.]
MNKKLKLIYKLKMNGNSIRKIKKELFEKYNIYVKEKEVANIVRLIQYTKNKFSEIEERKIMYLYSNFIDTEYLISYLNEKYNYELTYSRLTDLASRNSVVKKHQNLYKQSFITRSDERKIKELYELGLTGKEIAKLYGYKRKESIYSKLDKLGVKRRVWNTEQIKNKTYADFSLAELDSEFKAYFLGLMLTDGYINLKRKYIGLELTDEDCIKFLSEKIGVKYNVIDKKKANLKLKYRITLYGDRYIKEGSRLGLIEGKTFSNTTPNLYEKEKIYNPYIIRGAIDGDGWIRKDGLEFFLCSASESMIFWYKKIMEEEGFINLKVTFIENQWNGIYVIRTGIKYNLYILRNKVYKEPFGMSRKYELLR